MKLTPHLLIDGKCKQAMEFYHSALGGALTLTTVGDNQTQLTLTHTGFADVEHHRSHEEGWIGCLDKLATALS